MTEAKESQQRPNDLKPKRRRRLSIALAVIAIVFFALFIWLWPLLPAAWSYITLKYAPKRVYDPKGCLDNLRQLSTASRLYLDSEGAYPPADSWMDCLSIYLRSADLEKADQEKKLKCPDLKSTPGAYGYAYNAQVATKRQDDISDEARTPVIYDSEHTSRNAYDDTPFASLPKAPREGGNNVLWADGSVSPAPASR